MDKRIVKTRLGLDCQTPVCVDVINLSPCLKKKVVVVVVVTRKSNANSQY